MYTKTANLTELNFLPVKEIKRLNLRYDEEARIRAGMTDDDILDELSRKTKGDIDILEIGKVMTNILIDNYKKEVIQNF